MEVLDEARELVAKRLSELDEERQRLERALSELGTNGSTHKPRRRTAKRAKKGTVLTNALEVIQSHPDGISGSQIADELKMQPNYLYRLLKQAASAGQIRKDGRLYFAT